MRTRSQSLRWVSFGSVFLMAATGAVAFTGTASGAGFTQADQSTETTWVKVWEDDFAGPTIDRNKWVFEDNYYVRNEELQYYTDREKNARIENGELVIEAHREDYNGRQYTSASLTTQYKHHFQYGRFEMRAKLPAGKGAWPAFWTHGVEGHPDPDACHPATGEIDIMEMVGGNVHDATNVRNKEVHGVVHWDPGDDPACSPPDDNTGRASDSRMFTLQSGKFADDYHIFAMEWTPTQISWFMDGQPYLPAIPLDITAPNMSELHQPHYLLLNLAVGGNWPGAPNEFTVFPMQYRVDYVRVYADPSLPQTPLNPGGENKLVNPGLESGNTGWNGVSGNWSIAQPGADNTRAGSWTFRSVSTQQYGSGTGPAQAVSGIAANTNYVASFWLKGSGFIQLVVYNGGWGHLGTRRCGAASGTWTLCSYSFNTGANTSLIVQLQDHSPGTAYVDELYLGTAAGSPPPPPQNKLTNPGLEAGNTGWNGVSGNWSVVQPGAGNARSGSWAFQVVSTQQYGSGTGPVQSVSGIAANTGYVASFWLKGTGALQVVVYDGGWGFIGTKRCDATAVWTLCSYSFDTGANTSVVVQFQDHAAGTAYVDDAYLGTS